MQAARSILDAHAAQLHHITSSLRQQTQNQDQPQEGQQQQPVVVIGTGGTVTTLAALQLQLQEYVHEQVHMVVLQRRHIEDLMQQYLGVHIQPLEVGCSSSCWPGWLTAARAATLAPGCAGLLTLMDWLGVDEVCVSDNDLLDGVVAEMTEAL
jgi:exopolyphosphatase/guanosine-5'-triphosphate,3'-diphosphate pyrophosphatase